jgi:hypothetical protein
MTDPSSPKPPSRALDRSSLERVLARAAELQSGTSETGEEFTEEQLLELGREVGLSPQNLRQALAEERTRSIVPDEERGVAAACSDRAACAARTVPGKAGEVLAAVDAWMQRQELLIVKRHHADRIVWEPRQDFLVGIKRAFKVGGRDYALSHAFEVSATVISVDDGRSQVGLDADFRTSRGRSAQQTAVTSLLGASATASLFHGRTAAVAAAPVLIVPAIGIAGARISGRIVTRAQLALEQLLDQLERAEYGRRGPGRCSGRSSQQRSNTTTTVLVAYGTTNSGFRAPARPAWP